MTISLNFNPPVIAHRGASAYAPENTLVAFNKATQLGIRWIEFDVMQAADNEPVIFHDDTLERTTNGAGNVIDFPYSYLKTLDAGAWFGSRFAGERIPNLQSILTYLRATNMNANVEIKSLPGHEEALVKRVLNEMHDYLLTAHDRVLFSSFSLTALTFLRQYAPDCALGLLMHEWLPDWKAICQSLQCVSVHVNHEILTKELALEIKSIGLFILCYTVNDPNRAKELYSWGVDAVFSDAPDRMVKNTSHLV